MKHAGHCREFSKVYDSRYQGEGRVWRRNKCTRCGRRFTTMEVAREDYEKMVENTNITSEIQQPVWAVISPRKVEITDVPYSTAKAVQEELAKMSIHGVYITTAEAAARLPKSDTRESDRLQES